MNFYDEQAGERCHKRFKHARSHLARQTSPEDNLMDMLKLSLTWSDPEMSDGAIRSHAIPKKDRKDAEFSDKMKYYFKEESVTDYDHLEDDDYDDDDTDNDTDDDDTDDDTDNDTDDDNDDDEGNDMIVDDDSD